MPHPFEPYRIKTVEPIALTTRAERERHLKRAGYNLFGLKARHVTIDLLTDSGTSAMSGAQWAALMDADESYAGARTWERFETAVRKVTGYRHVVPAHQGRGAEHVLFGVLAKGGDTVPSNAHFDTTGANLRRLGATPVNLPVPAAADPGNEAPFKGDMDSRALERLLAENTARVPFALITLTNNSAAGQPVSMKNLAAVSAVCKKHRVPLFIDACRFAENAWFVGQREHGYRKKPAAAIAREAFALADGAFVSAKKDALANMGGFFATKKKALAEKVRREALVLEGYFTYGGMSARDMETVAVGLIEGLDEDYLASRIGQVRFSNDLLIEAGVPVVKPAGGHAVFLDATAFCPHLKPSDHPAQAIAAAIYLEGGIRSIGGGRLPAAHGVKKPPELVRLAIPRRVYTESHLRHVAGTIAAVYANRHKIRGLRLAKGSASVPIAARYTLG